MACSSLAELAKDLKSINVDLSAASPDFSKSTMPPGEMLDRWAETSSLGEPDARAVAIWAIREVALANDVIPASIQDLYLARAAGKWEGRTVPAMNLRGWSYPTIRAAFRAGKELNSNLFIFEQAVGESIYAAQPPAEYTAAALAAALREGYRGPVFMQADHDQVNASAYAKDGKAEVKKLEEIMRAQVDAGFYSLDIDASTVVDLSLPTVRDQQRLNAELTAHFTEFVRGIEPEGVTISLGAEIGEVGHENTTPEELREFMVVYDEKIAGKNLVPVSKISINTGTYHGGKMQPDGKLADVAVDYDLLKTISDICRDEFNMSGAVQHGASTLRGDQLAKFPGTGAVETHLALGFTNLTFDHPSLPKHFADMIRDYTFTNHANERGEGENDLQFLYNVRKKAWKVMKQPFWDLPEETAAEVMNSLQGMFRDMFTWMNVGNTTDLVREHTKLVKVAPPKPAALDKLRAL